MANFLIELDLAVDTETRVLTALSSNGCYTTLFRLSASDTDEVIEAMTRKSSGRIDSTWDYDKFAWKSWNLRID